VLQDNHDDDDDAIKFPDFIIDFADCLGVASYLESLVSYFDDQLFTVGPVCEFIDPQSLSLPPLVAVQLNFLGKEVKLKVLIC
jgi:hypothetical protein